ncbi:MocR-like pyridoxine biosynthesis transcription factor PdxR [Myroides injenensis]|uniref:MocR-like pyridoxine biosynthesis transcription factor PdxR n=1 Tax=Myroides injenensis TaxID=1183151 RepID=UPI00226ED2B1|nr:PLP-dependent aminotransferase family protein [Myroides injenensis]
MLRPWDFEINIEYNSSKAMYLQIADAIITNIKEGRLKKGMVLPGTRKLAIDLGVNRNTVVEAINVLIQEGYLISKERKGTFVADVLPISTRNIVSKTTSEIDEVATQQVLIRFDDGHPNTKIAPIKELARAYRQIFNQKAKWQLMGYSSAYGDLNFREAIVAMLNNQRGMHIDVNSLCITRGSQMAMFLTGQCLFEKGDCVIVEDPGYKPAWQAFEHAGAELIYVPVDKEGIDVEMVAELLKKNKRIKAIYITPHHQYPTTVTLALSRRLELIKLANKYSITIIEDDYDNEFHFGYRPILPLSSFLELEHYIYIGTLSKVVAPALRIGYLVSNNLDFLRKVGDLRKIIDVQGDSIMEQAVLQLIQDGTLKRHIKKATNFYKERRNVANLLIDKYLKDYVNYSLPEGGMAFWLEPKVLFNWKLLEERLNQSSISLFPPSHYTENTSSVGFRLSYGFLSDEQLEIGIKQLAEVFSRSRLI